MRPPPLVPSSTPRPARAVPRWSRPRPPRRAPFTSQLENFPELRDRLPPESAVTTVRGAGSLRQQARSRTHGRVLVGDAAGYIDALTGEGVSLALTGAETLVDNVRRGTPGRYETDWHRATRRHQLLTDLLVTARQQPRLAPRIMPTAARLPRLFAAAVNALA